MPNANTVLMYFHCLVCGNKFPARKARAKYRKCSMCGTTRVVKIGSYEDTIVERIPVIKMNKVETPLLPNRAQLIVNDDERKNPYPSVGFERAMVNPSPSGEWSAGEKVALGVGIGGGIVILGVLIYNGVDYLLDRLNGIEEKIESINGFQVAMTEDSFRKR